MDASNSKQSKGRQQQQMSHTGSAKLQKKKRYVPKTLQSCNHKKLKDSLPESELSLSVSGDEILSGCVNNSLPLYVLSKLLQVSIFNINSKIVQLSITDKLAFLF
jgi:hypothetical protein